MMMKKGAGHLRVIPALLSAAMLMVLAACNGSTTPFASAPNGANVLETATLDEGAITVIGPAGYCIDGKSLRDRGAKQFALLAQCDLLRNDEIAGVTSLSLLTVTAVRADSASQLPSAQAMADTFGPAKVLYNSVIDGIRVVQLSAGGESATKQADPVHWRGVMHAHGHTIGLAAYSMQDGSGAGLEGRNLLLRLARNIRDGSPRD